jgi:lactate dehydrogenase-like 2-hydroxyacid dehydrogenase
MKPKVFISQRIFNEAVALAREHFEVDWNESEIPLSSSDFIQTLKDKMGAIILLTDQINDEVLSQCPHLKIVSNVAVGVQQHRCGGV